MFVAFLTWTSYFNILIGLGSWHLLPKDKPLFLLNRSFVKLLCIWGHCAAWPTLSLDLAHRQMSIHYYTFKIHWYNSELILPLIITRCPDLDVAIGPKHHTTTTMPCRWDKVLMLESNFVQRILFVSYLFIFPAALCCPLDFFFFFF